MLSEINSDIINTIIQGETIEEMKRIADGSVDMILADLPYGTTACKWDTVIPFEPLWEHYERIIKPNGAIVLTASQPFTSALVMSNPELFKYEWIWEKTSGTNFMAMKYQPAKKHENILVFYRKSPTYNPIMEYVKTSSSVVNKGAVSSNVYGVTFEEERRYKDSGKRFPSTVQLFSNQAGELNNVNRVHPTQKPVALFEYLIRTYTNEGEVVFDNVIGSGTTAVAAINTGRQFIGIEREEEYVNIARERVEQAYAERAKTEVMSND